MGRWSSRVKGGLDGDGSVGKEGLLANEGIIIHHRFELSPRPVTCILSMQNCANVITVLVKIYRTTVERCVNAKKSNLFVACIPVIFGMQRKSLRVKHSHIYSRFLIYTLYLAFEIFMIKVLHACLLLMWVLPCVGKWQTLL